jgi:hypothetical protein
VLCGAPQPKLTLQRMAPHNELLAERAAANVMNQEMAIHIALLSSRLVQ